MGFIIKKLGGDAEAAKEVFSETILAAFKGLHTFEHKSSFFTWVCRIALNKIADYYRTQVNYRSRFINPGLELMANIGDNKLSPEETLVLKELTDSVKECLNLLPEEKRQLLYLRFWKDQTIKAIANSLGTSERAVEGRIYRAKLELKQIVLQKHPELALQSS